jgi:hypothetical protein
MSIETFLRLLLIIALLIPKKIREQKVQTGARSSIVSKKELPVVIPMHS